MPQKKAEQIGEMSEDELRGKERELQEQLFRLRFQKSIGQLDNAMAFSAAEALLCRPSRDLLPARRLMTPRPERGRQR